MSDHRRRELEASPTEVFAALARAAEMWGALWKPEATGGDLVLPVVQGLRRGAVQARIELAPAASGSRLELTLHKYDLQLNLTAVLVLFMGALGGLTVILWPLSPRILQLAPLGVVLVIAAWLMVVSRLRNSSVDDFLDLVTDLVTDAWETGSEG